jgi:polysaccharide export outer membrane protein
LLRPYSTEAKGLAARIIDRDRRRSRLSDLFVRSVVVIALAGLSACASTAYPLSQVPAFPGESAKPSFYTDEGQAEYKVGIGDVLLIQSYYDQSLTQSVTVRPDGIMSLVLLGDVTAVGKTTRELDAELTEKYDRQLPAHPDVTVTVDQMAGMVVYVGGEVKSPTMEPIKGSITLLQSITEAGGFLPSSNQSQVIVLRKGDGGHFKAFQIDASLPLMNGSDELYLRSKDVVYVPKTQIAAIDDFVQQYINEVVPRFVTTNFGYTFFDQVGGSTVTAPAATGR